MSTMGQRIAAARIAAGYSQNDLASAIGVSHSAIQQYEAGRIAPRPNRLRAIATITGRPMTWFHAEEGDDTVTPGQLLDWLEHVQAALQKLGVEPPTSHGDISTNERHTGITEMLGLHAEGRLKALTGIELTGAEVYRLEHLQYSGAPINTLSKAVEEVNRWRTWELQDRQRSS